MLHGLSFCTPGLGDNTSNGIPHNVGVHIAGADRVDGYALGRHLQCQRPGHAQHGVLGRAVARNVGEAPQGRHAGNIDDSTPAGLAHPCQCQLGAVENAVHVHVHGALPVVEGDAVKGRGGRHAGTVDQNFDAVEAGLCRGKSLFEVVRIGHIGADYLTVVTQCVRQLLQWLGPSSHQRDAMACGVQMPGDLGTDPGAGPRDQGVAAHALASRSRSARV